MPSIGKFCWKYLMLVLNWNVLLSINLFSTFTAIRDSSHILGFPELFSPVVSMSKYTSVLTSVSVLVQICPVSLTKQDPLVSRVYPPEQQTWGQSLTERPIERDVSFERPIRCAKMHFGGFCGTYNFVLGFPGNWSISPPVADLLGKEAWVDLERGSGEPIKLGEFFS